ncbi:MAG: amidase family protein [Defluviitaleaceae bacterium]|nr:amidase family protein [Defluviitaleaceae bacterium]
MDGLKNKPCGAVVLEDVIMQKAVPLSAGSAILKGFKPLITATAVTRLMSSGYTIAGTAETSELGINGFFDNALSEVLSQTTPHADQAGVTPPSQMDNIPNGATEAPKMNNSLGGAIEALHNNTADFALCNDIFAYYRKNVPKSGLCYIHPTYGTVSRYGLIPVASSIDQIGVLCKNIPDGLQLLSCIAGNDPNDGAMLTSPRQSLASQDVDTALGNGVTPPKNIRIAIPKNITSDTVLSFAKKFDSISIEIKHADICLQLMQILTSAEFSNNINRYDGIKFGKRAANFRGVEDLYVKTRSEGFGHDAKLAAILGGLVLSQGNYDLYYDKAMKIRRLVKESLRFDSYDVIAMPAETAQELNLSALAGLPSCSFSFEGQGLVLVANACCEEIFKTVWEACQ